jgi:hypothetical protein
MSAVEMSRADAVALVQRIMQADYDSDDEVDGWLDRLDRALASPTVWNRVQSARCLLIQGQGSRAASAPGRLDSAISGRPRPRRRPALDRLANRVRGEARGCCSFSCRGSGLTDVNSDQRDKALAACTTQQFTAQVRRRRRRASAQ